jgi:hypothetical protein
MRLRVELHVTILPFGTHSVGDGGGDGSLVMPGKGGYLLLRQLLGP